METATETARDYSSATSEERTRALETLGLSLKSTFVPFSQSKHANPARGEKVWRSLNWKVTLSQGKRDLLITDYAQGEGHCPAYHHPPKFASGRVDERHQRLAIADEIETGKTAFVTSYGMVTRRGTIPGPSLLEVCYSLAMDAQSGQESFSDFCSNFGYEEDSRKAEKTWRACADIYKALGGALLESMSRIVEGY